MKARYAVLTLAATLLIGCAKAEEPATTDEASSAAAPGANADQVRAAVQKHFDAAGTGNAAVLDSLTATDFVHVDATGDVHSEQQLIEKYRAAPAKYTAEQIDVRVYGDVAVVNARVVDANNQKLHVTQVWALRHAPQTAATRAPVGTSSITLVSRPVVIAQIPSDSPFYEMVSMHASAMSAAAAMAGPSTGSNDDAAAPEADMNKPAN